MDDGGDVLQACSQGRQVSHTRRNRIAANAGWKALCAARGLQQATDLLPLIDQVFRQSPPRKARRIRDQYQVSSQRKRLCKG